MAATEEYALGKLRGLAVQLPARSELRRNDIENCAQLYAEDLDRVRGAAALLAMTTDMMMGYKKTVPVTVSSEESFADPEPLFEMSN